MFCALVNKLKYCKQSQRNMEFSVTVQNQIVQEDGPAGTTEPSEASCRCRSREKLLSVRRSKFRLKTHHRENVALLAHAKVMLRKKERELVGRNLELNNLRIQLELERGRKRRLDPENASPEGPAAKKIPVDGVEPEIVVNEDFDDASSDLLCSICHEMFVTPVNLNCSHSFCFLCIETWKSSGASSEACPICRESITAQTRSLVLEKIIVRHVDRFDQAQKERRGKLEQERKLEAEKIVKRSSTSNMVTRPRQPFAALTAFLNQVFATTFSETDSSSLSDSSSTDSWSDDSSDDSDTLPSFSERNLSRMTSVYTSSENSSSTNE
jgi:Zinc finger, C3HC4 type (RING finger)